MKFNQMIPEFDVKNLEQSLHFYVDLLGFKVEYTREEDLFAFISLQDVQIMLQEISGDNKWETGPLEYPFGRGINFQIDMIDIDKIYNKLKENHYEIFVEMEEHWYRKEDELMGCKEFLVKDPNGYLLRFSEDIENDEIYTNDKRLN